MLTKKKIEKRNNFIEKNYEVLLSIRDKLCTLYDIPEYDRDEVLSSCHYAVMEIFDRNYRPKDMDSFLFTCCRNKFLSEYFRNTFDPTKYPYETDRFSSWIKSRVFDTIEFTAEEERFIELIQIYSREEIQEMLGITTYKFYSLRKSIMDRIEDQIYVQ